MASLEVNFDRPFFATAFIFVATPFQFIGPSGRRLPHSSAPVACDQRRWLVPDFWPSSKFYLGEYVLVHGSVGGCVGRRCGCLSTAVNATVRRAAAVLRWFYAASVHLYRSLS